MKIILFLCILSIQFYSSQYFALLLILMISSWSLINTLARRKGFNYKSLIWFLLWTFMIVLMIRPSLLTLAETKIEIFWLLLGCVAFFIISLDYKLNRIQLVKTIVLSGGLGAIINLIGYTLNWYPLGILNSPYAGTRWVGGFDGPNEFGTFYVMMIALAFGLFLEKEYNFLQMLIKLVVFIPLVYFSYSRGSLLIFLGIVAFFVVYSIIKVKRKFTLFFFYLIISLVFANKYFYPLLMKFNNVRENASDRDYLFMESFSLFKEKFILGHGLGSFGVISNVQNTTPHSDYLLFLVSGGLVGIGFLIYFYANFAFEAFKRKYLPELFLLLVFYSQSFTFNSIVRGRLSILFWIIVILIYLGNKDMATINKITLKKPKFVLDSKTSKK